MALPLALLLAGCGDSKSSPAYPAGGGAGGAAAGAGAGGAATGATSAGTTGLGAAGANVSAAGSGTIFGAGGAAVGGTAGMGTAGAVGQGGQGNGGDNAGNGGTGGAPAAVYTIVGCTVSGVGGAGAGGASAGAGGASAGAGGASAGAGGASAGAGGKGGASGAGGAGPAFASFSVYDWVTDKPVQTCLDETVNFTITVSGDAPLTVVANFAPGAGIGSVVFTYDGVDQPIQDIFPYALAPDNNGDFSGPTPPLAAGKHTLAVAAYDQSGAMGNLMGRASVVLTVVSTGP